MSNYIGNTPGFGQGQTFIYSLTGGQASVSGPDALGRTLAYTPGLPMIVALNGALLSSITDFTATNGNSITFSSWTANAGDEFVVIAFAAFALADTLKPGNNLSDLASIPTARGVLGLIPGTAAGNIVQLDGSARLPAVDGSQLTNVPGVRTGTTVRIAGNPPSGYLWAQGGAYSRSANAALFAQIGVLYGAGDGSTTFNIPDDQSGTANYVQVAFSDFSHDFDFSSLVLTQDNRILLIGGETSGYAGQTNATRFYPINSGADGFAASVAGTSLPAARTRGQAVVLGDGRVLYTGGWATSVQSTTYFGTISGNTITWVSGTALPAARSDHTMLLLSDGRVLVAGGNSVVAPDTTVNNTYFGVVSGNSITWTAGTSLPAATAQLALGQLPDGRLLAVNASTGTVWLGTISGDTITWVTSPQVYRSQTFGGAATVQALGDGRMSYLTNGSLDVIIVNGNDVYWSGNINNNTKFRNAAPIAADRVFYTRDDGRLNLMRRGLGVWIKT